MSKAIPQKKTKYVVGDKVEKLTGDYGGPGEVIGILEFDGKLRYEVAFKIENGFGRFVHILSEAQLCRAKPEPYWRQLDLWKK